MCIETEYLHTKTEQQRCPEGELWSASRSMGSERLESAEKSYKEEKVHPRRVGTVYRPGGALPGLWHTLCETQEATGASE